MNHFSRVLVAVDFSKAALHAFEHALALSTRHGAELVGVHAVQANQSMSGGREHLASSAELCRRAEKAGVKFQCAFLQGDPAEVILSHARSLPADLIVMGTHQRVGIRRFRTGSVAARVAAQAMVPVLVVPQGRHTDGVGPFRRIAIAQSARSVRTIEGAMALVSDPTDRLTLLHVVPRLVSDAPKDPYSVGIVEYQDQLMRDDQERLVRDARRRLQTAAPLKLHAPTGIDTRVLLGDVTTEIGRAVNDIGADLLVVGVSTRGVVRRALFGTTAARLLKVIGVPLLAVPSVWMATAHQETRSLQLTA